MGLLDDAIREHLELKRRRGDDPNEVERLEHEALGPVRRGPQVSDEPFLEEESLEHESHETLLYDDEADEPYASAAAPALEPELADEPHQPFQEEESERGWSYDSAEEWDVEEPVPADEPQAPAAETPAGPAAATPPPDPAEPSDEVLDHPGQETVEYDVEAEHERGEHEDDPLEETPEFLQDTPDHDRLWFEQRPPRDFDFDK